MCGICGFVDLNNHHTKLKKERIILEMTNSLIHRGPDDGAIWLHDNGKVSFGHRRLSILDLSPNGSQPMLSKSGRYSIVFNGEIYNHLSLRSKLTKYGFNIQWSGHSDTETLLECIDKWGIEKSIQESTGMFSIAIFDIKKKSLYLVRDRMGEKPLYYGFQNGVFLFASELKALKNHPSFSREVDQNALKLYFKYSYIPSPYSIYKGINKLEAGTILKLNLSTFKIQEIKEYWSLQDKLNNTNKKYLGNFDSALSDLSKLLGKSVQEQMIADVSLGAFLSGGVDSSLIVSLMQSQSDLPVETFTIGFSDDNYNEAIFAEKIAKHLGTNHTELYVSSNDAIEVIGKLPDIYDEPFSDSSQIPTYLISEMTKKNVSVCLSGDAGDELFGGYNRYIWTRRIWQRIKFLPLPIRKFISYGITSISPSGWHKFLKNTNTSQPGDKLHKLSSIISAKSIEDCYMNLITHWDDSNDIVKSADNLKVPSLNKFFNLDFESFEQRMMFIDAITYLPDDILTKVDRASMSVSLETRMPFLNHDVIDFSYNLPMSMKINDGQSKWILRQLLDKYVPRPLIERPKMGFGVPIDSWLRGPLKEWGEALLEESRLEQEGYLNFQPILKKWREHQSGKRNWQYHLWDVLIFQSWLEKNK